MKAFMIASMITAGSLAATGSQAQVYVRAGIGFRVPAPRVYVAPAPVVTEPAPEYDDPYVDPYAEPFPEAEAYAPPVEFYYNYPVFPAWNGHFRDRFYFEHYRPSFERYRAEHFRGNYGGRPGFARGGYEHRDAGRGGFERGGSGRGNLQRGSIGQREYSHGGNNRGGVGRGGFEHGGGRRH